MASIGAATAPSVTVVATPEPEGPPRRNEASVTVRPALVGLPPIAENGEVDVELAGAGKLQERAVDGEQDDQRRGNADRRAVDAFQRHVHVADQARNLVVLVRPGRRQDFAEERIEQEARGDERQDPAGGAPHRLEDEQHEHDAEEDVPVVRQDRAVEEIVAAGDEVDRGGDAGERRAPSPTT